MQETFSDMEYAAKKKPTRRDRFLREIETLASWSALVAALEPHYPKGGGRRLSPIGLERILRMYITHQCFGLSDDGMEGAIYDSQAIRHFVGIDMGRESAPDATTLLKFQWLLETHSLTEVIFATINEALTRAPRVRIVVAPFGELQSGAAGRRRGSIRTGIQGPGGSEAVAAGEC